MILVDKEIAVLAEQSSLIDSFDPRCLTNIGYDLRAKYFAVGKEKTDHVSLLPGESVFVAAVETIHMPNDLLCRVVLKKQPDQAGVYHRRAGVSARSQHQGLFPADQCLRK